MFGFWRVQQFRRIVGLRVDCTHACQLLPLLLANPELIQDYPHVPTPFSQFAYSSIGTGEKGLCRTGSNWTASLSFLAQNPLNLSSECRFLHPGLSSETTVSPAMNSIYGSMILSSLSSQPEHWTGLYSATPTTHMAPWQIPWGVAIGSSELIQW